MANLLLVILIVAGLLALPKMRSQFFPDIIVDNINLSFDRSSFAADFSEGASFGVVGCALKASSNAMISSSSASLRESDALACSSSHSSLRSW